MKVAYNYNKIFMERTKDNPENDGTVDEKNARQRRSAYPHVYLG